MPCVCTHGCECERTERREERLRAQNGARQRDQSVGYQGTEL